MKLFGFFGKSSDDEEVANAEEATTPDIPGERDLPEPTPSSQSPVAADRGATMSDVIKAVTDQFALINVDSDADLRAVGAALCQIPEGMSPLSEGFTSFRHEVLHAILMAGEVEGLTERAMILDKCLTSIADSPDLAEHGIALQILAGELREGFLTGEAANSDTAAASADSDIAETSVASSDSSQKGVASDAEASADQAGAASDGFSGDDDNQSAAVQGSSEFVPSEPASALTDASQMVDTSSETPVGLSEDDTITSIDEEDEVAHDSDTEPQQLIGKLAHADQLISAVGAARAGLQSERAADASDQFGEYGDDMTEFVGALGGVTSSCLQALDTCFSRELDTLSHYRDVCAELEQGSERLADSSRCITFIDAGLRGEASSDDLSGTENQWLSSLSNELGNVTREQTAIAAQKGQQIKGQIAEIQLEADQANELIKKLGAETLEPPATVLQSLTGGDFAAEEGENEPEVDYEDSIDQYIEWMKKQREAIREQRRRIEELDHKMADAERDADRQYAGRLEPVQRRKEELTRNLEDALHSANKDAEETKARLDVLTQDAATLIGEYKSAVDRRVAFAANVEDAMASAMIRLGKVLDEANMNTSPDAVSEE
mgnify:FL=1